MKLNKRDRIKLITVLIFCVLGILLGRSFLSPKEKPKKGPMTVLSREKIYKLESQKTASVEHKETAVNEKAFSEVLQKCFPSLDNSFESPDEFFNYLKTEIGFKIEDTMTENYHLLLPDGSERRIHIVTADNTNSVVRKELRFFRLDEEGYPERIPLNGKSSLEYLLKLGEIVNHEVRSQFFLIDGTVLDAEFHNQSVFEFQYNKDGKILCCRNSSCICGL